jgi:hypothetical protein
MAFRRLRRRLRIVKARTRGAAENEEVGAMKVLSSSDFWGVLMMVAGDSLCSPSCPPMKVG